MNGSLKSRLIKTQKVIRKIKDMFHILTTKRYTIISGNEQNLSISTTMSFYDTYKNVSAADTAMKIALEQECEEALDQAKKIIEEWKS